MCVSYSSFTEYLAMVRSAGVNHWRTLEYTDKNPNAINQDQRSVSRWTGGEAEGGGDEGSIQMLGNDAFSKITL